MIQFTYQRKLIHDDVIQIPIYDRIIYLSKKAVILNTAFLFSITFFTNQFTNGLVFELQQLVLMAVVGALQILATVSVTFSYGLGNKFVPGFSGVYPSLGSSIVFFDSSLNTILMGLCFGLIVQIIHNFFVSKEKWNNSVKNDDLSEFGTSESEMLMTVQYAFLGSYTVIQRIIFGMSNTVSISEFATAEKITQSTTTFLTGGFNQYAFNNDVSEIERRGSSKNGKFSKQDNYLLFLTVVLASLIYFQKDFLALLFNLADVNSFAEARVAQYVKPLLILAATASVGGLITSKLYSVGEIRLCALTGVYNATLISGSLFLLLFTNKLNYIAIAYLICSAINMSIKIFQWYAIYLPKVEKRFNRGSFLEILRIYIALISLVVLSLVSR